MFVSVNLNWADRILRTALGLGMIVAGWSAADGVLAFVLRLFAFYPLATGIAGWSPVYELFHIRTKR